jgi:RHS repeat-associated protein
MNKSPKNSPPFSFSFKPNSGDILSCSFENYPKPQISDLVVLAVPFSIRDILSSVSKGEYRYGFNGKETDSETDLQDYGFRIYNPSYGKFLSVDPLFPEFPWNSPYAFAENDVIRCIDLDGLENFIVTYTIDASKNIQRRRIEYVKESERKEGYRHHKVAYRLEHVRNDGSKDLEGKDKWKFSSNPDAGFRENSIEQEYEKKGAMVNGIFFLDALERWVGPKHFDIYPLLGGKIDFEHNKPIPRNPTASDKMLKRTAEILKANPGMKIQILGHTSSEQTNYKSTDLNNPYGIGNKALSWDRAKYVNSQLVQLGVQSDQLSFDGVADTQPLPGIAPEADKQKRIEFKLTEDKLILD